MARDTEFSLRYAVGVDRRTRIGLWLCFIAAAGCTDKEDGDGVIDTVQECEDAGGYAMASPVGRIQCGNREEEIGTIPQGIEATICCRPVERTDTTRGLRSPIGDTAEGMK